MLHWLKNIITVAVLAFVSILSVAYAQENIADEQQIMLDINIFSSPINWAEPIAAQLGLSFEKLNKDTTVDADMLFPGAQKRILIIPSQLCKFFILGLRELEDENSIRYIAAPMELSDNGVPVNFKQMFTVPYFINSYQGAGSLSFFVVDMKYEVTHYILQDGRVRLEILIVQPEYVTYVNSYVHLIPQKMKIIVTVNYDDTILIDGLCEPVNVEAPGRCIGLYMMITPRAVVNN